MRDLDYVKVLGKEEPVKVWELISEVGKEPEQYKKILPAYNEALKLYQNQEWLKAIEAFKASDELEDMFPGRKTVLAGSIYHAVNIFFPIHLVTIGMGFGL